MHHRRHLSTALQLECYADDVCAAQGKPPAQPSSRRVWAYVAHTRRGKRGQAEREDQAEATAAGTPRSARRGSTSSFKSVIERSHTAESGHSWAITSSVPN